MSQNTPKFISYKKLAIFGSVGSGKSSLIERLETGAFPDTEIETKDSNHLYIIFIRYLNQENCRKEKRQRNAN